MSVDVQRIIDQIMSDPRLASSQRFAGGHFTSRMYDDEPILKTGSQMLAERSLPEPYRAARAISCGDGTSRARARLFYEQGLVLADATDEAPYHGEFERYYPTYQAMNDRQLRGYITWRTHVRAGQTEQAPLSFMFVYVYELLNGIGVSGAEEGFTQLRAFWLKYRDCEPVLSRYIRKWLVEYVAYHNLSPDLVLRDDELSGPLDRDRALMVVLNRSDHTDEEVFSALATLSSYRIENSRLYREQPEDVRWVSLAVLDRLEQYYLKNRSRGLWDTLFGSSVALPYRMFETAVFYEAAPHPDAVYEFNPIRRFICSQGMWTYECYPGDKATSTQLGSILRAVDACMRERCAYPYLLKTPQSPTSKAKTPKYLERFIDQEAQAREDWKRSYAPVRIEIDRSKLEGIRTSAARTREALLVDEERESDDANVTPAFDAALPIAKRDAGPNAAEAGVPQPHNPPNAALPGLVLEPYEKDVLSCLFTGGDLAAVLSNLPVSVDMAVDAINEKLFDVVGDTVIELDGATPVAIEDYREEVCGLLKG